MPAAVFTLSHQTARDRARDAVRRAPEGYVVRISEPKRSLSQNDRLWPLIRPISRHLIWHGERRTEQHWKDFFLDKLGVESASMIDETGATITVGRSSANLSKPLFTQLMDLVEAFKLKYGISDDMDYVVSYPAPGDFDEAENET